MLRGTRETVLEDISALFPSILVIEASKNYLYTEDIDRVSGVMAAISYFDGPIALSKSTIDGISTLFQTGSKYIPYEIVLQGIFSISWGGLYVELYRCIEPLFSIPRLRALTKGSNSEKPLGEIMGLLEKHLSWRPKEDEFNYQSDRQM